MADDVTEEIESSVEDPVGKLEATVGSLAARVEELASGQSAVLARLEKLEPVAAVNAEGEAVEGAIAPETPAEPDITPPPEVISADVRAPSPLARFHEVLG